MSTDPKPKAPRKPAPRGKRAKDVKDQMEHTDRVVAGTAVGEHAHNAIAARSRINRLKELIEPKTDAMIQVMYDIAMNTEHTKDPKNKPSIHASIRMECADRLLSRAYGKPKEHVEITDSADAVNADDEVMGLLNNILEAVGAPKLESPKAES